MSQNKRDINRSTRENTVNIALISIHKDEGHWCEGSMFKPVEEVKVTGVRAASRWLEKQRCSTARRERRRKREETSGVQWENDTPHQPPTSHPQPPLREEKQEGR